MSNLLLSLVISLSLSPQVKWYELMGTITCPTASVEKHFVRKDYEVTMCQFEDRLLLFLMYNGEKVQCVQFDAEGDCPDQVIVY